MLYQPINCNFYDELVLRAMRRMKCHLVFKNAVGELLEVQTVILDVFTEGDAEYARLEGIAAPALLRLDQIVSVDGILASSFCVV